MVLEKLLQIDKFIYNYFSWFSFIKLFKDQSGGWKQIQNARFNHILILIFSLL